MVAAGLCRTMAGPARGERWAFAIANLSKTNLQFFSSHRTDFRPGFPHSRAQDVSTHSWNVPSRQILRKLASAANPGQTSFFNRISTPDPSWLARAHPGVPDGDSGTV